MDDLARQGIPPLWPGALDALPQGLLLVDRTGRVVWVNRTCEEWGLGVPGLSLALGVHRALHPACRDHGCRLAAYLHPEAGMAWSGGHWEGDDPHLGPVRIRGVVQGDGAPEAAALLLVVEREGEQPTGAGPADSRDGEPAVSAANDPPGLPESPELLAALVHGTPAGLYVLDGDAIVFCNERFAELFGYSRRELYGRPAAELIPSCAAAEWPESDGIAAAELCTGVARSGEQMWLKSSSSPITLRGEPFVLGSVIEITEQVEAQEEIRRSEEELELLSAQLITLQEMERKRISAELHDSIGQHLSIIKFAVEDIQRRAEVDGLSACRGRLRAVVERIRSTMEEVRRIAMDLRPSILDDLGLLATVEWICREFSLLMPGIAVEKQLSVGEAEIPDELKLIIFRLLQEGFHNIAKHAGASRVGVSLTRDADRLRLEVVDDGRGFRPDDAQLAREGLGLRSMRERVRRSGGVLALESAPDRGTRLAAEWLVSAAG